jgi:hypothetical protein
VVAKFKVRNSIAEGVCVVRGVERACRESEALGPRLFAIIICTMIDVEAVDDGAVSKWFEEAKATVEQNRTFIENDNVKRCVQYASQDDDDDDDDDDDED